MDKLVQFIAESLVEHPEDVVVTRTEEPNCIRITLAVNPGDIGKVIGRGGRIARAIRMVVKAASSREDKKVAVEIL